VNGIRKVGGDKIRLKLPLWSIPEIFAFTVTGAHQNTVSARAAGQLDVAVTITNNEGARQVDGMLAGGAVEHACLRLAAIASVGRGVRTIVYGVQMSVGGFELLGHEFMDRLYKGFRKIAAANPGLVCYHNYRHLCVVQAANGIRYAWQDTKSADVIQVADFFGNGAVTVEKNGGLKSTGLRQGAPPATKSSDARPLRRRQA
jgi:hypothetical protein